VVPDEFRHNAHHWLILHGRYTCVARVPKCPACVILDLCEFKHKTRLVDPEAVDRVAVKRRARPKPGKTMKRGAARRASSSPCGLRAKRGPAH
jgi:hypothetical protein